MGMMPERPMRPTVGLIPTSEFADDGQTTEPSVSEPTAAAQRLAAAADPEPELEPHGLRSWIYAFFVCPPRPLQPLLEWLERKFAHSLRFVLPRITAPASRNFFTTKESCAGCEPTRASEPAVVIMRSAVSILSLIKIGTPCKGPRMPFSLRSRSRASAIAMASGLTSITEFNLGPSLSMSSIRSRYFFTNWCDVYLPDCMPACKSEIVSSSSSKSFGVNG